MNCDSLQNNPLVLRDAGIDKSQTGHELIMSEVKGFIMLFSQLVNLFTDFYNKTKHYKLKT